MSEGHDSQGESNIPESSLKGRSWGERIKRMSDDEIIKLNLHHMSEQDAEKFGLTERFKQIKSDEVSQETSGGIAQKLFKILANAFTGDDDRGHPKKPGRNSGNRAA